MDGNHNGSGSIQFGSVKAAGKWKQADLLVVTLETASLTAEQTSQLKQYCSSSTPVAVHLPGHSAAVSHTIAGFDRGTHATTFYLAAVSAKK